MKNFTRIAGKISTNGKKVTKVEVNLVVYNASGTVNITDIMMQGGTLATLWTGHPSELEWSFNA